MTLLYADTSALVGAYFADEPDHAELRASLLEGAEPVFTNEITRVELASAVRMASKHGRLRRWRDVLARFDAHCQPSGPVLLVRLRADVLMPAAYRLVIEHDIRTLDALHLATALTEGPAVAEGDEVLFVTRDAGQATAAAALGFTIR